MSSTTITMDRIWISVTGSTGFTVLIFMTLSIGMIGTGTAGTLPIHLSMVAGAGEWVIPRGTAVGMAVSTEVGMEDGIVPTVITAGVDITVPVGADITVPAGADIMVPAGVTTGEVVTSTMKTINTAKEEITIPRLPVVAEEEN